MKCYHSSDQHGHYTRMSEFVEQHGKPELWVLTGDFFPNLTRGDAAREVPYQTDYFMSKLPLLIKTLSGTPILVQDGNHCYASLAQLLTEHGFNAHQVRVEKQVIEVRTSDGSNVPLSYAGFREIPRIDGEWAGESDNATLTSLVNQVIEQNSDLLINHAPPSGIMDGTGNVEWGQVGYGIPHLTSSLMYQEHDIRAVLFGHQHRVQGERIQRLTGGRGQEIIFSNAATTVQMIEL